MKRHLRNAIARIDVVQDGQSLSRGTGFLVTERLVLTALHVVANRRSDPPEPFPGTITLQFPGHTTEAQIYEQFFDRSADWVLLKCADPPSCAPIPLAKLEADGLQWETYGFPDANPRDGMVQIGSLENHDASLDGSHAFQLFSRQAAAGSGAPVKGLSGAPVIVDGAVVGLLRFALMKDGQTVAGTVYACSTAALVDRAGDFLKVHNIDDWREMQHQKRRRRMIWGSSAGAAALALLVALLWPWMHRSPGSSGENIDPTVITESGAADPHLIAVLPFSVQSPESESLAAGMDSSLREGLLSSDQLRVLNRTSTLSFVVDGMPDLQRIRRESDAGTVLCGEFRQADNALSIQAWLIDVSTQEERWRRGYQGQAGDLFALHDRIASDVAAELGAELGVRRDVSEMSLDAYPHVVRGNEFLDEAFDKSADIRKFLQPPETDLAIEQFEEALRIKREPLTLALLSQAYSLKGLSAGREFADMAQVAWEESLAADPELVEGFFARGLHAYWHKRDYGSALWWFNTTIKKGGTERVEFFAGLAARRVGNWTEAHEHINRAAEMDPLAWEKPFEYGRTSLLIRDYEEADRSFGYSMEEDADTPFPYLMRAMTLISWKGDLTGAQDAVRKWVLNHDVADLLEALMVTENRPLLRILDEGFQRTLNQVEPDDVEGGETSRYLLVKAELCRSLGGTDEQRQYLEAALSRLQTQQGEQDSLHYHVLLALVHAGLGHRNEALLAAGQAAEAQPISADHHRGAVTSSLLTEVYITLGEYDLALQHVDQLLKNPSYLSIKWIHADPLFDPLRDDPRLQQLLDQGEYPTRLEESVAGPERASNQLREQRDAGPGPE